MERIALGSRVVLCLEDRDRNEVYGEMEGEFTVKYGSAWTLERVDRCDQMKGNPMNAVLMAYFALDDTLVDPSWLAAQGFQGPTLELPRDPALARQELFAAIEAIQ